jgi:apolipoprotein N-acyltransferase
MMRNLGFIVLLVVVLIVGWLSTRQIAFVQSPTEPASSAASAPVNVRQQSQQIQQQVQQQLNQAMEQATRNMPDDAR